ncbi:MAG: hypothetical protein ACHQ1H_15145, partial [Nitrososphaerales archaeon]
GNRSLGQVAFLLFNRAGNEITSNSTLLMGRSWLRPGDSINFNTVCNQSGTACKFHFGDKYQLEVIAWIGICSCDEQLQLTGNVTANNKVYSFDTYPMIVLRIATSVHPKDWNITFANMGTKTVHVNALISWQWNCNQPSGCYASKTTIMHKLTSGESFKGVNIPIVKPHDASKGTYATIYVTASYTIHNSQCDSQWTAQLTMSRTVPIKA